MSSFNDATCPKCGKRIGWVGNLRDKPACPKCGFRDSQEELERVDKMLEEMEQKMLGNPEAG